MDDQGFENWLRTEKRLGAKTCKDVVSRCKRVERALGISLDRTLTSPGRCAKVCDRLNEEVRSFVRAGAQPKHATTALRHATRLYAAYKGLQ
jgi:hypothetical protein